jgi:hypothetical protein
MKKKNLNQLHLKKNTIANFNGTIKGGLNCIYDTGSCNATDFYCPSDQTCQTLDVLCRTQITCGPETIVTLCFCV